MLIDAFHNMQTETNIYKFVYMNVWHANIPTIQRENIPKCYIINKCYMQGLMENGGSLQLRSLDRWDP